VAHQYDNTAQQRILRIVLMLAGHELHGVAPKDIAEGAGAAAATITRDLHNLREIGLIETIQETGRVRLGPKVVQIAIAHMTAMDRASAQLNEIKNRYSREP
jgi:DNA-binding IclR family transcriptional regulator